MPLRHLAVLVAVAVVVGLAAAGWVGPAVGRERIVGYQVVAQVQADGSVRIREVIDWEFGPFAVDKHGIFRDIPVGMAGRPEAIVVASPGAPDDVQLSTEGTDVRVRIGDPAQRVRGRQRYEISYVLRTAVRDGRIALDLVGTRWDVPIERLDARIVGAELTDVACFRGEERSTATCEVETVDGGIRADVESLGANRGVTVEASVGAVTEGGLPAVTPMTEREPGARARWGVTTGLLGLVTGLGVYLWFRRIGRNEVAGDGATEAAFAPYGDERFGPAHDVDTPPPGVRMVADEKMGELAGLEFAPPGGIEPWQGAAVLREAIDGRTVGAWFASLAAHDVVRFSASPWGGVRFEPGSEAAAADTTAAPILNRALAGRPAVDLGAYDEAFSGAWGEAGRAVEGWVRSSGVFRRRPPSAGSSASTLGMVLGVGLGVGIPVAVGLVWLNQTVAFAQVPAAILLAVLLPGLVAVGAYWRLVRSLSWRGSAIALRTESFRRFLHDSEAQHVEWAWQHGLLREYSAWAVALDEADAWNHALAASGVPPEEAAYSTAVMAPAIHASSFASSHTAPSSSDGDGGGGSVGGGDGGGGGGSW